MSEFSAAVKRVKKVAKGATINGTYKMFPIDALKAFRNDLLLITAAME